MPENILSQKNMIAAGVVLGIILGLGYGGYQFWQGISSGDTVAVVDPSLFGKDLQDFYAVKDKVKLTKKDMAFTETDFYKNLQDNTVEYPPAVPTGRPNPFWAP